jgi:hypothetical protein
MPTTEFFNGVATTENNTAKKKAFSQFLKPMVQLLYEAVQIAVTSAIG